MQKEVIIVGTCHFDPFGQERLEYALRLFDPSIIAAETSEERRDPGLLAMMNAEYERRESMVLERHGISLSPEQWEDFRIKKEFASSFTNYELRTIDHHVAESGCDVSYIDLPFTAFMDEWTFCQGYIQSVLEPGGPMNKETVEKVVERDVGSMLLNMMRTTEIEYMRTVIIRDLYPFLRMVPDIFERTIVHDGYTLPSHWSKELRTYMAYVLSPERDEEMAKNIRSLYDEMEDGRIMAPVGLNHLIPLMHRLEGLHYRAYTLDEFMPHMNEENTTQHNDNGIRDVMGLVDGTSQHVGYQDPLSREQEFF